ncbi:hypothetical protein HYFRA_00003616 [Hymenoscyphus fraxineus]|uniref:Cullin family profile domain-containing protein n=1 Tax=Hymenoscyphus fraxineus TaxID=746836 RepID=A0A9N9L075_9HELO|nr:hypothetical protein HYFRA_00003616 [Hymenoscyphus fraxineus]
MPPQLGSSYKYNPFRPKRKLLPGEEGGSSSSSRNSSSSPPLEGQLYPQSVAAKRQKISHTAQVLQEKVDMSKLMGRMLQPKVIDLTSERVSNFQPHSGAKRLVIKNLREGKREDVEKYYKKTWEELDAAITAVFSGQQPKSPLEVLCRGVEATCRHGLAENLARHLKERCKNYLEKTLLPIIETEAGTTRVGALRAVYRHWVVWNNKATLLRSIFSYLNQSYLLNSKELSQLEEQGINQYKKTIWQKSLGITEGQFLGGRVVSGVCELVDYDRDGKSDLFDSTLLKESILMLHVFGIFGEAFHRNFVVAGHNYCLDFAESKSHQGVKSYVAAVDQFLEKEAIRCDTYNFDSTTKRELLDTCHNLLIKKRSEVLLDQTSLSNLIEENDTSTLKTLYDLLKLSGIQQELKKPFEAHIKKAGSSIVREKEKVDDMVVRLLELKRSLGLIIRDAFSEDAAFTYSLREAFGNFINDSKNTTAWGTNNSKVGEMIAKYIDMLLRGGEKAIPRSLQSDAKDRDAAEKQGTASSGDQDAELDRALEQGLELFRFIQGKDVFEAFYKKDLARRLLMARSASQDAERNMLAKLKGECGYQFTHNLEQMFKDQEIAKDEMVAYKRSLSNTSKTTLDLQVNVLSAAAWPSYPDVKVNLPAEVAKHIEKYDMYYQKKHTGRRLTWKHSLAHSVVRAQFDKGAPKELLVSAFQAIVLVLFNDLRDGENLSYNDIQTYTGLIDAELERTLQSLACGKFRVLTKHPKGRDVLHTDTFTVNTRFTDPKIRIKINQIQLKETKEENKETHERVHQDRQYETQAAIVRIMKTKKRITHARLTVEVVEQTKMRGAVEVSEIKKNIEKLIEKDYIERDEDTGTYVYLA